MKQSSKVILNTGTLYIKIIITTLVTLFSTRIALNALGVDSFGLYNLIAGIIILLSFLNGALLVSTQRFLSIAIGEKNYDKLSSIFNVSVLIHILIAAFLAIVLIAIKPLLFDGFLSIKPEMVPEAERVYEIMILTTIITLFTVPYNSVINAREEMWFFAISEILIALLKLFAAIYIMYAKDNLLTTYTFLMLIAILAGTLTKYLWCRYRYKETRIRFRQIFNKPIFKEMIGFISWNTLGSASVLFRNQGVAIVLNIFFGTAINAAYGIANNLNSMVLVFSTTLSMVFTPMIIMARGEGNDNKMLFISILSSKTSFYLSSVLAIPILLYTPLILKIWLGNIPEYSVVLSRLIILSFLVIQLYPGITRIIYAVGDIKYYQIIISIFLISIIPLGYIAFKFGCPPYSILIIMIISQICTLLTTVYFAKIKSKLDMRNFIRKSVINPVFYFCIVVLCGVLISRVISEINELIDMFLTSTICIIIYSVIYYKIIYNRDERILINNLINKFNVI